MKKVGKNSDCTIVINSYDGGEDLWDGFFTCLEENWPDNPFKIILNTESKKYNSNSLCVTTYNNEKLILNTWAYRFKRVLKKIDTEYVLVFLDDFWLDKKVDTKLIIRMIDIMKKDNNISNICFRNRINECIDNGRYELLVERKNDSPYVFNCQVGIWKRKRLIRFLRNHESAWDWELYGNHRAKKVKDKFYCIKKNYPEPFVYSDAGIIHRGKWIKEDALYYANKYNIKIDFSKRGFEISNIFQKDEEKPISKKNNTSVIKTFYIKLSDNIHKLLSLI